ncbi:spore germination protein [Paenibacillus hexagrammi]|uniref:spore germination protein n=1 Tax=Paenibacillus hexagrammi TaxID=2908839 RepID=UPI0021A75308|nr:spore germination protein [Paenibacillus sp. YPD9-1]
MSRTQSLDESLSIASSSDVKAYLQQVLGNTDDLMMVPVRIAGMEGLLCYLKTMTSSVFMMDNIIKPMSQFTLETDEYLSSAIFEKLREACFGGLTTQWVERLEELTGKLLEGYAGLAVNDAEMILSIDVKNLETRSVDEPTTQTVVRGPKEGFTESAQTNMSLIRRRLFNERLRFDQYTVGKQTRTNVYVAYIEGNVDLKVIRRVKARLKQIEVQSLLDSGTLEELLRPRGFSLFPTIYSTERPDKTCALLIKNKLAIIVNGSPFVLIVPTVMNEFFSIS